MVFSGKMPACRVQMPARSESSIRACKSALPTPMPTEAAEDIARLRELHMQMDQAVAAAYGWGDLDLGHGFHQTAQGVRYTISEAARREVLRRLLELNYERYDEEVSDRLHPGPLPCRGHRGIMG